MALLPVDRIRQHGFVTADLPAAIERAEALFGIKLMRFNSGDHADGPADAHAQVALGSTGDLIVEIIQPEPVVSGVYEAARAASAAKAQPLVFHHLGYLLPRNAFEALPAGLAGAGIATPLANLSGDIRYVYADLVPDLGHFLKFIEDTPAWARVCAGFPR